MTTNYNCVTTVAGIQEYIGNSAIVAFDFETAPDDPYREEDKAPCPHKADFVSYQVLVNQCVQQRA